MSSTLPPFTLRQLTYFVAVADSGTIAAVARTMHVSPSAISDSITELERLLDLRLCVRHKAAGFSLTPAGKRLLPAMRSLLRQAGELTVAFGAQKGELSGPLTISCYLTLAPMILPVLLREFGRAYPRVDLQVLDTNHEQLGNRLESGEIDLAVAYDWFMPENAECRMLFRWQPYILVAADHPLAGEAAISLEMVESDNLILYDYPPANAHTMNMFTQRGLHPRVTHRIGDFETVRAFVAQGLGYTILIRRTTSRMSYEGLPLETIEILPPVAPIAVNLIWRKDAEISLRKEALIAFASTFRWLEHFAPIAGGGSG